MALKMAEADKGPLNSMFEHPFTEIIVIPVTSIQNVVLREDEDSRDP